MAVNQKISALNSLAAANLDATNDTMPIVDTSDTETKKISVKDAVDGYVNVNPLLIGGTVTVKNSVASSVQPAALVAASETNGGLIISTNGTGALMRVTPDNTFVGGDSRGDYATDLQRTRNNQDEVASGSYSTVSGGISNKASGDYSVIVGGQQNQALQQHGFVGGGLDNINNGDRGVIVGGYNNQLSSQYGNIAGGRDNNTGANTYSTVLGGFQNSSTGQYSISGGYSNVASNTGAVALGYDNTASGVRSVAIGNTNTATGSGSTAFGSTSTASGESSFAAGRSTASALYSMAIGEDCVASQRGAVALGYRSKAYAFPSVAIGDRAESTGSGSFSFGIRSNAYLYAQCSYGADAFASVGDAQGSFLVRKIQDTLTTGATTTVASNLIPNGNNRVWNVTVETVAVVTSITGTAIGVSVGDSLLQNDIILFSKIGGTSSVVGTNNTQFISSTSLSTALMGYSAGASQELALTFTAPTFTGGGSVTMRVVSKVSLVEVAY